jgi:hypothetical protein
VVEQVIGAARVNSAAGAREQRIAAVVQAAWVVAREAAAERFKASIAAAAQRAARASAAAPAEQALAEPEPGVDPAVEVAEAVEDGADKQDFRCRVSGGA